MDTKTLKHYRNFHKKKQTCRYSAVNRAKHAAALANIVDANKTTWEHYPSVYLETHGSFINKFLLLINMPIM